MNYGCRGVRGIALAAAVLLLIPMPAQAQIGIYDALARRFSDVSFFGNVGGLATRSEGITAGRLSSFGIEVLLEIGSVSRPVGPAPVRRDSVALNWTEMRVTRGDDGSVDTVYSYQVRRVTPVQRTEPVWTFELGLGYGQTTGFGTSVPGLDLRGAVRDLPTVTLYASYEATSTYLGLRSGFMRLQSLQLYDADARSFSGEAESFMAGVALGQSMDIGGITLFIEAGYAIRPFPSIRWTGGALPAGAPRSLNLDSWTLGAGIQFGLGTN
jgi:hypothetical protein